MKNTLPSIAIALGLAAVLSATSSPARADSIDAACNSKANKTNAKNAIHRLKAAVAEVDAGISRTSGAERIISADQRRAHAARRLIPQAFPKIRGNSASSDPVAPIDNFFANERDGALKDETTQHSIHEALGEAKTRFETRFAEIVSEVTTQLRAHGITGDRADDNLTVAKFKAYKLWKTALGRARDAIIRECRGRDQFDRDHKDDGNFYKGTPPHSADNGV